MKAPKLINIIKENDKTLKEYKLLKVFRRSFSTFVEITVLVKTENVYRYYYIKKIRESKQYIYIGFENKEKATMKEDQYLVSNPEQKIKKDELNNKVIQFLNAERPDTKDRAVINIRVREFPTHTRYLLVVRLSTSRKRFVIENTVEGLQIVEEKVMAKSLKEINIKPAQEEALAIELEDVVTEINEEVEPESCEDQEEMKEVVKKEESELIKMIRENNPSFEDFKIVKRFKNNHIKTFREITLLIRVQRDEV